MTLPGFLYPGFPTSPRLEKPLLPWLRRKGGRDEEERGMEGWIERIFLFHFALEQILARDSG